VTDASVPPDKTSATLLERARSQSPEAWERLVELYGPLVYRWCRAAGLREESAADIGQDVFQAVFRKIGDFKRDPDKGSFRGWLKTITMHKIYDSARRMRPGGDGEGGSDAYAKLLEVPEGSWDGSDDSESKEEEQDILRRAIESILKKFNEETRRAFLRLVVDGQAPADVARELGTTVNAVYLAKSRVKKRFREEFDGLVDW
jgi:RNA polymerase sigma-70 factor (ECF subfamily)